MLTKTLNWFFAIAFTLFAVLFLIAAVAVPSVQTIMGTVLMTILACMAWEFR